MQEYNTVHYLIALLKEYGINHIIASPGTQNSTFNFLAQTDPFFECYSVVDERSASYTALGLSQAIKNPVAITSTGATAARNYMSAMTEAYYSNTPVIALTAYSPNSSKYNAYPQYTDRSVSQNDIKDISVTLPEINNFHDKNHVITAINAALSHAKYNNRPVHINFPASFNYKIKTIPEGLWKTEYYYENFEDLHNELAKNKTAIFIGQHRKFTEETENAISDFAKSYDIPVICDHNSNYNGANKVSIVKFKNLVDTELTPDIIIDLGGISAVYGQGDIWQNSEIWRITEKEEYKARFDIRLTKILAGKEKNILKSLTSDKSGGMGLYSDIHCKLEKYSITDLPLSLLMIANEFGKRIPENSYLHLAILRSAENMYFADIPSTVEVFCNVGGFGIDGPLSSAFGQSLANKNKKVFCLVGDLAFFYDMNILGNRHIGNNLRIMIENNCEGLTMRYNSVLDPVWGDASKELVSAAGHYKNGAKGWAESCGFKYMSAKTKEEFMAQIDDFCNKDFDAPVIFEVFTTLEGNRAAEKVQHEHLSKIYPNLKKSISLFEQIFSVKNEYKKNKKYKVIRLLGTKIKVKVNKNGD